MTRFLARRVLNYVVLLALASFLTFCLTSVAFSPLESLMQRNPRPPQAVIDAKAAELGLNKPIPLRYANWASHAVRGDFGTTVAGQPVSDELWRRIGVSLRLLLIGSVAGTVIGVVVGAWGAIRQYRRQRPRHHDAVAAGAVRPDIRDRQPADPRGAAGQLGAGCAAVPVHRGNVAGGDRRRRGAIRRSPAAPGVADAHADAGYRRGLQPLSAQRDARRARPGLHPHRAGQGPDPAPRADQARAAHGADPDGDAVRLRRGRSGDRRGVRREDLRLARHGRVDGAGHRDPGHQHRRGDHGVRRRDVLLAGLLSDVIYAALDPRVRVS